MVAGAQVWQPHPEAARFVGGLLDEARARSRGLERLAARMRAETGTRLIDWIDHLTVPSDAVDEATLRAHGFVPRAKGPHPEGAWVHPGAMLPPIEVASGDRRVVVSVDSVPDFLVAHGAAASARIDGPPGAPLRRARVVVEDGVELWVVERHGADGFEPREVGLAERAAAAQHYEALLARPRSSEAGDPEDVDALFDETIARVRDARAAIGDGSTLALFFRAERAHWQSRNAAARAQKARQDALGLGWANHDHHTYRSSRHCFHRLVELMEAVGLARRERFYAGAEAGWGAQVFEHPTQRLVVFADVDLSPEEVAHDFAGAPLPQRDGFGTVGLWCALHGESALGAGLHHLECQFDFDAAREQLASVGVESMEPFTDLPVLRQAFTVGERWRVDERRAARLRELGAITAEDAARFVAEGALGSHLEILERHHGYRGFNQQGISHIIRKTDPRAAAAR